MKIKGDEPWSRSRGTPRNPTKPPLRRQSARRWRRHPPWVQSKSRVVLRQPLYTQDDAEKEEGRKRTTRVVPVSIAAPELPLSLTFFPPTSTESMSMTQYVWLVTVL